MKRKLQIFISSTFRDLKEERQAAVEAILNASHIPAGMELFAAGDKSQFEIIKKWIDESDIFLLILGGRYGSIDEKTQKSYTQLEYEYAESIKKPLCSIVSKDTALEKKAALIGYKEIHELKEPQKYEQFKKYVSDKMVAFYDDIKDIKIEIPKSIDYLKSEYTFTGWVSGKEVAKLESQLNNLTQEFNNLKKIISENHQQVE